MFDHNELQEGIPIETIIRGRNLIQQKLQLPKLDQGNLMEILLGIDTLLLIVRYFDFFFFFTEKFNSKNLV